MISFVLPIFREKALLSTIQQKLKYIFNTLTFTGTKDRFLFNPMLSEVYPTIRTKYVRPAVALLERQQCVHFNC